MIYKLASERISEKYLAWEKKNPEYNNQTGFYPNDSKLIGKVMACKRTVNNKYLLTPAIQEAIMENLDFTDVNELYWGNDVDLYFEELFTTLLLEAQTYRNYQKHWMGTPLATEIDIRNFYRSNRDLILGIVPFDNAEYKSLKDRFIDFTFNRVEYFEFDNEDRVGEYIEDEPVSHKDGAQTLTFVGLPKKLDIFVEKAFCHS